MISFIGYVERKAKNREEDEGEGRAKRKEKQIGESFLCKLPPITENPLLNVFYRMVE